MTRLAVIRHGPTAWNAAGRIQGRSDIPLSVEGRAAVRTWRLPDEIAGGDWRWICSPLKRTRETAALLNPDAEAREEARLVEMDWGAWEGQVLADLRAADSGGMIAAEARGLDFRPPGGESPRDVQARIAPLLASLARAGGEHLAVTHKGVIRALYAWASGWDMTGRPPVKLRDGCAHVYTLDHDGGPSIEALNLDLTA